MTTAPIEHSPAMAQGVQVTVDTLPVDLADGRSISVPVLWYPRLATGTPVERRNGIIRGRAVKAPPPGPAREIAQLQALEQRYASCSSSMLS